MNTTPPRTFSSEQRQLLRRAIRQSLPNEAVAYLPPKAKYIFVPTSHRRALDPDAMLVTGIRGAGKSFWWHILRDQTQREFLGREFLRGQRLEASSGFGEVGQDTEISWPLRETLDDLVKQGYTTRLIWRAVLLEHLQPDGKRRDSGSAWIERVGRLKQQPELFPLTLQKYNEKFQADQLWYLLLFDALEHTASSRNDCLALLRGVLELTLELRKYSNIAAKAFVRPDMLSIREVSNFPDSAKVLANQVALHWSITDLYALLFQYLGNGDDVEAAAYFRSLTSEAWKEQTTAGEPHFVLPATLRNDAKSQEELLRCLAGPYLGAGSRNGRTYQQLFIQLADAHGIVSPRSFLTAIRRAADHDDFAASDGYALQYQHIIHGIRDASKYRVEELKSDHLRALLNSETSLVPSPDGSDVEAAMRCLRDLEVPSSEEVILDLWKARKLQLSEYQVGGHVPTERDYQALLMLCEQLGVVERLPDGQFNVPNLYLTAFGLRRTGRFRRPPGR